MPDSDMPTDEKPEGVTASASDAAVASPVAAGKPVRRSARSKKAALYNGASKGTAAPAPALAVTVPEPAAATPADDTPAADVVAAEAVPDIAAVEPEVAPAPELAPEPAIAALPEAEPVVEAPVEAAPAELAIEVPEAEPESAPVETTPIIAAAPVKAKPAKKAPAAKAAPRAKPAAPVSRPSRLKAAVISNPEHIEPAPAPTTVAVEPAPPAILPIVNTPPVAQAAVKKGPFFMSTEFPTIAVPDMEKIAADMQGKAKAAYAKGSEVAGKVGGIVKSNVDAVVESGKTLGQGLKELGEATMSDSKEAVVVFADDLKELITVASPAELLKFQGKVAVRNLESMYAYANKSSEAFMALAEKAFAPITSQFKSNVETIRSAA